MSKTKSKTPPTLTVISSGKGGCGKSTTASAIVDILHLSDNKTHVVQVDDQDRLSDLYPGLVSTVSINEFERSRQDPNAIISAFDPLHHAIESYAVKGNPLVVDVGATQQHAFLQYAALTDLDEDLSEANVNGLWVAPCTAEPESMRQAVQTILDAQKIFTTFRFVIALNERDGNFEFYPKSSADTVYKQQVLPLISKHGSILIPQIAAGSWQAFETCGLKFVDVVNAEIPQIQNWTGVSRPMAKVMRGDVSAWLADMFDEISPLLVLDAGGENE